MLTGEIHSMLIFYALGIVLSFDWEAEVTLSYFFNAHFMASVAISGFFSPWMYIHLKRAYEEPVRLSIRTLTTLHVMPGDFEVAQVS